MVTYRESVNLSSVATTEHGMKLSADTIQLYQPD